MPHAGEQIRSQVIAERVRGIVTGLASMVDLGVITPAEAEAILVESLARWRNDPIPQPAGQRLQ